MKTRAYLGLGFATLHRGAWRWLTVEPRERFEIARFFIKSVGGGIGQVEAMRVDGRAVDLSRCARLGEMTMLWEPVAALGVVEVQIKNYGYGDTFAVGAFGFWEPAKYEPPTVTPVGNLLELLSKVGGLS